MELDVLFLPRLLEPHHLDGRTVVVFDVLGAGAVMAELGRVTPFTPESDAALIARRMYVSTRGDLRHALAVSRGGRNVIAAGLSQDIDFAARLDVLDVVGVVDTQSLGVRP